MDVLLLHVGQLLEGLEVTWRLMPATCWKLAGVISHGPACPLCELLHVTA